MSKPTNTCPNCSSGMVFETRQAKINELLNATSSRANLAHLTRKTDWTEQEYERHLDEIDEVAFLLEGEIDALAKEHGEALCVRVPDGLEFEANGLRYLVACLACDEGTSLLTSPWIRALSDPDHPGETLEHFAQLKQLFQQK